MTASFFTAKSGTGIFITQSHLTMQYCAPSQSNSSCIFRTKPESNRSEEQKLLFGKAFVTFRSFEISYALSFSGLLFSLKGFAEKLSNKDGCVMHSYKTGCVRFCFCDLLFSPMSL